MHKSKLYGYAGIQYLDKHLRIRRKILALLLVLAPLTALASGFAGVESCPGSRVACPMMRMAGCQMRACCHGLNAPAAVTPAAVTVLFAAHRRDRAEPLHRVRARTTLPSAMALLGFPRLVFHPPLG